VIQSKKFRQIMSMNTPRLERAAKKSPRKFALARQVSKSMT